MAGDIHNQLTTERTDRGSIDWVLENRIVNEKGDPIEFYGHPFLQAIYDDQSQYLTVMKAAQVGMSTCQILKNHRDAKRNKMDIIYTLPTDKDVSDFVGGKVNRLIANNIGMLVDVENNDSIEKKQVGDSMIYFRGTWTKKAAIMITADRLVHDEKDSSKLDVISDYQARLQHSRFKQIHTFSHPSLPEIGVHSDWLKSDQKHWMVTCEACGFEQFLNWDIDNSKKMSIDLEKKIFVCKHCRVKIDNYTRATGRWKAKYPGRPISGYWVPLLICPWMSAEEIISKYNNPEITPEFFSTKILGLPFADASSKLLRDSFFQNLTGLPWAPTADERIIGGLDTGLRLDYVLGNKNGLFFQGDCTDYGELNALMDRWKNLIFVVDAGGDLIGSRSFAERWPGRVYLCYLTGDRKKNELAVWGKGDEHGAVTVDRNRAIQLCVDEFRMKLIRVHGTQDDWFEYWLDWNNLSKMKVLDPNTNEIRGYKWIRNGRDHRALATVFWRVGMMRFAGMGSIVVSTPANKPNSYVVNPNQTVDFNPKELFDKIDEEKETDWRNA
jgi:hypothetical protein